MAIVAPVLWATVIDALLGEPPAFLHPTVGMGHFVRACAPQKTAPRRSSTAELLRGAAIVATGAALSATAGMLLSSAVRRAPAHWNNLLEGVTLKPALSLRALLAAAAQVEHALARHDLAEGRRLLAWHLVSRDTSDLTSSEVAGAAIESIAENLSDGFIAPLMAYRAGGIGAAYAYRFVNTTDAMLGYRTDELEWLGKVPARVDDVLNLAPARVTAALIALAAPAGRGSTTHAWRIARREARKTWSPNAGWPMAAMAGALDCRLTKRGVYTLNGPGTPASARMLRQARRIVGAAAVLGAGVLSVGRR